MFIRWQVFWLSLFCRPSRSLQSEQWHLDGNKSFNRDYSSGNCSGFTPDSLFAPNIMENQTVPKVIFFLPPTIVLIHIFKHVGFELGTAFSSFGSGKNMLSTYVAPNITFQPTSKLQMYIGAYLGHNNAYGFNNNDVIVEATPVAAYSGANYFLTDRVNLFGNSLYGRGSYAAYPYGVNNDFKSISVGVSYRVSPRTTISAQFQWSSGLPPYGTNYWNGPLQGFTTPFDNPALGTATGSPIK